MGILQAYETYVVLSSFSTNRVPSFHCTTQYYMGPTKDEKIRLGDDLLRDDLQPKLKIEIINQL